jgi:hypothetical protein
MRRSLLLSAAGVVLLANGWSLWQAARNRGEAVGGTLNLTECEVPLQAVALESSVTLLRLNWKVEKTDTHPERQPAWLDTHKLAELGFDCSVPLSNPGAARHYGAMPSRRVFLAMEYEPVSSEVMTRPRQNRTGLKVVDAALDPSELRAHYADPGKNVICRGLVRLNLRRHDHDGALLSPPRLEPWIQAICPSEVSVPEPVNRPLLTLHRTVSEAESSPTTEPRFAARIFWGRNYEPWVEEIRLFAK